MGDEAAPGATLRESPSPLTAAHDLVLLDLDGVVYIGGHAVPRATEAIDAARQAGARVAFVTNNASRTPEVVAGNLVRLGVGATADQVVTSSQAAARMLAAAHPVESRVLMLGAEGLATALVEEALVPVTAADDPEVRAVVTGFGPDVVWRDVMRVAVRVREGLPWVATNTDMSLPTSYGVAPGHGVMVRMLSQFSGVEPEVAGKPHRPLLDEAVRRAGGRHPLMVGDRLDTDIEGAHAAGMDSLLVLTGVTDLTALVAAAPGQRPTYLSVTLEGLGRPHPAPTVEGPAARCGGWVAEVSSGALTVRGGGEADDWWRAAAAASWAHLDAEGTVADVAGLTPPRA
ncbi:HAD-IIA family hydrolase [Nocardioides sp.]|uniref:HAD-IIA family hydrolase n=1 Tax=Nocardioides sp. TaxID=35761 RepID=UPI003526CCB0